MNKVKMVDIDESMLSALNVSKNNVEGFVKIGMQYADAVINSGQELEVDVKAVFEEVASKIKRQINIEDENITETYFDIYNELIG